MVKSTAGKNNILVKILLTLLIASFAIFGVGGGLLNTNSGWVAKVGETEVKTAEFNQMVQNQARQYQQAFGGQVTTAEIIQRFQIDNQVLNQAMATAAFAEAGRLSGLRATQQQISEELLELPYFQINGVFNRNAMETVLRNNSMTIPSFERSMARDMQVQQLVEAVSAPRPENTVMASWLHAYEKERRTANLVNISLADVGEIDAPTDEDIQAYYDANTANFMEPERRSWQYVLLTPAVFMSSIELEEEDIVAEYERNIDEWSTPETREIQQVGFKTRLDAENFVERISTGGEFVKIAAEMTDFSEEEISIGTFTLPELENTYDQTTAEAVFALGTGTPSEIIQDFAGFSVFRVATVNAGENKSLEDVREEIRSRLVGDLAIDEMYEMRIQLEDELGEEPSLPMVAEKLGLTVATVTDLDASGRKPDGSLSTTSAAEQAIARQAFTLFEGDPVELVDVDPTTADEGIFGVQLTTITPTSEKTLESVRAQIITALTRESKLAAAGKIAETVMARINAGELPEDIIQETGGAALAARNVGRQPDSEDSRVAANIRALIYDLVPGEVSVEQSGDGNGYVVVQLTDVNRIEVDPNSFEVAARAGQLQTALAGELQQFYNSALLARFDRSVNNPLIQQLYYSDQ